MKKRFRLKPRFKFTLLLIGAAIFVFTFLSQEGKLKEIANEKAKLESELYTITNETERYERMAEYAKSDEYLQEQARQKFGWVKPGDIIIKAP